MRSWPPTPERKRNVTGLLVTAAVMALLIFASPMFACGDGSCGPEPTKPEPTKPEPTKPEPPKPEPPRAPADPGHTPSESDKPAPQRSSRFTPREINPDAPRPGYVAPQTSIAHTRGKLLAYRNCHLQADGSLFIQPLTNALRDQAIAECREDTRIILGGKP